MQSFTNRSTSIINSFPRRSRGSSIALGTALMFLSFQLFEKCFEQPRMTGWCDKALLAHLVDALDKRTGQTELDKLGPDPPSLPHDQGQRSHPC